MSKKTMKTKIYKNFTIVTEETKVNEANVSSVYNLLDQNLNYVSTFGKYIKVINYVDQLPETKAVDLVYALLQDEKTYDQVTEQDKRNLISTVGFRIHANNNEDFYYYLEDTEQGNLGDIESEKFSSLDDIMDRIDHYFDDYFMED